MLMIVEDDTDLAKRILKLHPNFVTFWGNLFDHFHSEIFKSIYNCYFIDWKIIILEVIQIIV